MGLPLFADSFTENYTAAYLKGENSSDSIVGGNYSSKFNVLKFPVTSAGEYYIKNNEVGFSDVSSSNSSLYNAVSALASKNIISGKADGIYGVNDTVTRAEAVTLLCKLLYLDTETGSSNNSFSDVSRNSWYYSYVITGKENNILQGYEDDTFRADNTITKQEFVSILGEVMINNLGFSLPDDVSCLEVYSDSDSIAGWAKGYAALLEEANIKLDSEEYEPSKSITRGDAAELLYGVYRFIQ